jgi:hypothetical protein
VAAPSSAELTAANGLAVSSSTPVWMFVSDWLTPSPNSVRKSSSAGVYTA